MSEEQHQQEQQQEQVTEPVTEIEPISAPPTDTTSTSSLNITTELHKEEEQQEQQQQQQPSATDESVNLENCIATSSEIALAEAPSEVPPEVPSEGSSEIVPTDVTSLLKELDTTTGPTTTTTSATATSSTASPATAKTTSSPSVDSNARSVHVGNVEYKTKESELEELFGRCGAIRRVTILNDFYTKRPKGCAYIEFEDPSSVESALLLTGTDFNGRQIKVTRKENRKRPAPAPFPTPFGRGGRFMPYGMPYPFMMPQKRFKQ